MAAVAAISFYSEHIGEFKAYIMAEADTPPPCIASGSYNEYPLNDGTTRCTVQIFWGDTRPDLDLLRVMFAYAETVDSPRVYPRVRMTNAEAKTTVEARLYSGSVTMIDHDVVDMWESRAMKAAVITWVRATIMEVHSEKSDWNQDDVALAAGSYLGTTININVPNKQTMYPARIRKLVIMPGRNDESVINKLWLGFKANLNQPSAYVGGELSGTRDFEFNPSIEITPSTVVALPTDKHSANVGIRWDDWGILPTSILNYTEQGKFDRWPFAAPKGSSGGQDWTNAAFFGTPFRTADDNENYAAWRPRFAIAMQHWNSTLTQSTEAGRNACQNMVGRYHVLMRYKYDRGSIDKTKEIQGVIGVEAHGTFKGKQWTFIENSGRKYINYIDDGLHWIDLGELDIGGPGYTYEQAHYQKPADYAIAISAALLNPTVEEKGDRESQIYVAGVRLCIDKFVLVPSEYYLAINAPIQIRAANNANRRLDIYTDDQMAVSALIGFYSSRDNQGRLVSEGFGNATTLAQVLDINAQNWSLPPQPLFSKLVVVMEGDGASDSTFTAELDMYIKYRVSGGVTVVQSG